MQSCPFDSHKYVKQLLEAGVATPEAEAMAALAGEIAGLRRRIEALEQRMEAVEQRLAAVEHRLAALEERVAALEIKLDTLKDILARQSAETDSKIAAAKNEMIRWMFGFFVAQMTGTFALIKAFA